MKPLISFSISCSLFPITLRVLISSERGDSFLLLLTTESSLKRSLRDFLSNFMLHIIKVQKVLAQFNALIKCYLPVCLLNLLMYFLEDKVVKDPILSVEPFFNKLTDPTEEEIPDLYTSCVVTPRYGKIYE